MKLFNLRTSLPLVLSLALATGLSTQALAQAPNPGGVTSDVQFTARSSNAVVDAQTGPNWTLKSLGDNQWEVTTSGNDGAVNFLDSAGNILFHFNPRPNSEGNLVMNSTHNGWWGAEERMALPDFAKNGPFTAKISVDNGVFEVTLVKAEVASTPQTGGAGQFESAPESSSTACSGVDTTNFSLTKTITDANGVTRSELKTDAELGIPAACIDEIQRKHKFLLDLDSDNAGFQAGYDGEETCNQTVIPLIVYNTKIGGRGCFELSNTYQSMQDDGTLASVTIDGFKSYQNATTPEECIAECVDTCIGVSFNQNTKECRVNTGDVDGAKDGLQVSGAFNPDVIYYGNPQYIEEQVDHTVASREAGGKAAGSEVNIAHDPFSFFASLAPSFLFGSDLTALQDNLYSPERKTFDTPDDLSMPCGTDWSSSCNDQKGQFTHSNGTFATHIMPPQSGEMIVLAKPGYNSADSLIGQRSDYLWKNWKYGVIQDHINNNLKSLETQHRAEIDRLKINGKLPISARDDVKKLNAKISDIQNKIKQLQADYPVPAVPDVSPKPVSQEQLEFEMNTCGLMDDANKMYTRCLQVNHPNHHGGNYARWDARGTLCTTLVQKHNAPVWFRPDVANETEAALNQKGCVSPKPVSQEQLESEMNSCGLMDDANKMYTRCLQVNHPNHHGGNYARWDARGTLCTTLVQKHDAPVWYRQDVANETDAALNQNTCIGAANPVAVSEQSAQGYFLNPGTSDKSWGGLGQGQILADLNTAGPEAWLWNANGIQSKLGWKIHYTGKSGGKNLDPGDTVTIKSVCKATHTELNRAGSTWIIDAKLVDHSPECGHGWELAHNIGSGTNGDLNQKARGRDVYLCVKRAPIGTGTPLTNIYGVPNSGRCDVDSSYESRLGRFHGYQSTPYQLCKTTKFDAGAPLTQVGWQYNGGNPPSQWTEAGQFNTRWKLFTQRAASCNRTAGKTLGVTMASETSATTLVLGHSFTGQDSSEWTIRPATGQTWKPTANGLNVLLESKLKKDLFLSPEGRLVDLADFKPEERGAKKAEATFQMYWDVKIAPSRPEILTFMDLREGLDDWSTATGQVKRHTDAAVRFTSSINELIRDCSTLKDAPEECEDGALLTAEEYLNNIRPVFKLLKMHKFTKRIYNLLDPQLKRLEQFIERLNNKLQPISNVTTRIEGPLITTQTTVNTLNTTSTKLFYDATEAMQDVDGISTSAQSAARSQCSKSIEKLPSYMVRPMGWVMKETGEQLTSATGPKFVKHMEYLDRVANQQSKFAEAAERLRKINAVLKPINDATEDLAKIMDNVVARFIVDTVETAADAADDIIAIDAVLDPFLAPVQAEIEGYLGIDGNLFNLGEFDAIVESAVWDQIKTELEKMEHEVEFKPEDLKKLHPKELLKNKEAMQKKIKSIKSKAPGVAKDLSADALETMAKDYATSLAQDQFDKMTAGCFE